MSNRRLRDGARPTPAAPRKAPTRAELLRRRAELAREQAAIDEALATLDEREARITAPSGYVDQSTSPLGKRGHLAACRAGMPHRAIGKKRIARVADVEAWMDANDKPRRRRAHATQAGADLAEAFGVAS